jgi:hypothetical protein
MAIMDNTGKIEEDMSIMGIGKKLCSSAYPVKCSDRGSAE